MHSLELIFKIKELVVRFAFDVLNANFVLVSSFLLLSWTSLPLTLRHFRRFNNLVLKRCEANLFDLIIPLLVSSYGHVCLHELLEGFLMIPLHE